MIQDDGIVQTGAGMRVTSPLRFWTSMFAPSVSDFDIEEE